MNKKLWQAESRKYLYLTVLFLVPTIFYVGTLFVEVTAIGILCGVLFLVLTVLSATFCYNDLMIERAVNKDLEEMRYAYPLIKFHPEIKDREIIGITVDETHYPVAVFGNEGYETRVKEYAGTTVRSYEYIFSDPENNMLVVFDSNQPPALGGVMVFVK